MNKKMYEEIMRVVYDYAINKKELDRVFLEKIIAIIVSFESLNNYVRELIINEDHNISGDVAGYDNSRVLIVYWCNMLAVANEYIGCGLISDFEGQINKFKFVAGVILHELIHARQEKEKNEKKKSFKTTLLKLCDMVLEDKNAEKYMSLSQKIRYKEYKDYLYRKYKEYHDYAPSEREANIEEFLLNAFISTELNKMLKNLYVTQSGDIYELKSYFLLGYKDGLNPADYYFDKLGLSKQWQLFAPHTSTLTLEEKVIYGLDVPIEKVKEECDRIIRKRIL